MFETSKQPAGTVRAFTKHHITYRSDGDLLPLKCEGCGKFFGYMNEGGQTEQQIREESEPCPTPFRV